MADIITVQFAAIEQASSDCNNIAGQLDSTLAELKSYLDQLVWTGAARESYTADQQQWNTGAQEIQQILVQVGQGLARAEQTYSSTESSIAGMFG